MRSEVARACLQARQARSEKPSNRRRISRLCDATEIFVLGEYLEDKRSPAIAGLFVLYGEKATRGSVQLTDTNIRLCSSDKSCEVG